MLLALTAGGVSGAVALVLTGRSSGCGFVMPISQAESVIDRLRGGR